MNTLAGKWFFITLLIFAGWLAMLFEVDYQFESVSGSHVELEHIARLLLLKRLACPVRVEVVRYFCDKFVPLSYKYMQHLAGRCNNSQ